jgi:hypothetical protein
MMDRLIIIYFGFAFVVMTQCSLVGGYYSFGGISVPVFRNLRGMVWYELMVGYVSGTMRGNEIRLCVECS